MSISMQMRNQNLHNLIGRYGVALLVSKHANEDIAALFQLDGAGLAHW